MAENTQEMDRECSILGCRNRATHSMPGYRPMYCESHWGPISEALAREAREALQGDKSTDEMFKRLQEARGWSGWTEEQHAALAEAIRRWPLADELDETDLLLRWEQCRKEYAELVKAVWGDDDEPMDHKLTVSMAVDQCAYFENAEAHNRLRDEVERLRQERDAAVKACKQLLSLPNWQNRIGPWKDINDAVQEIKAAVLDQVQKGRLPMKDQIQNIPAESMLSMWLKTIDAVHVKAMCLLFEAAANGPHPRNKRDIAAVLKRAIKAAKGR